MEYQPVMCVKQVLLRYALKQFALDDQRGFPERQPGSIGDPKNMRVHGHCGLSECSVEYDIGRLSSDTW